MTRSGHSGTRWLLALVVAGVSLAGSALAWQRGWITSARGTTVGARASTADDAVPENLELDDDAIAAQREPDDDEVLAIPPEERQRMGLLDDSDAELGSEAGLVNANFEEVSDTLTGAGGAASETQKAKRAGPGDTAARAEAKTARAPQEAGLPSGSKAPLLDLAAIDRLEAAGDIIEAHRERSRHYWQIPDERERLLPHLNKLAQSLYFSPQPHYYEPYVVKPGDQLRVVSQQYRLSWEYLARLNRVDARRIRMGQKLKVVPGPFAALVTLSRFELVVHVNGSFVKSYRVGIGKDGTTPVGTFEVKNKMADPTYYGPEGVIAHDDPTNPLGERWIDIGDSYGLHGTIDPDSIGRSESRGCIRLLNTDVEEVYDFLVIGSEVKIQR